MKACWADNALLPMPCVLDTDDFEAHYGCEYVKDGEVTDKLDCPYWNEVLAVELAKEILGDGYAIFNTAPPEPCTYTQKQCTHFTKGGC